MVEQLVIKPMETATKTRVLKVLIMSFSWFVPEAWFSLSAAVLIKAALKNAGNYYFWSRTATQLLQVTSRARRMAENCQHVLAGRKLRKLERIRSFGIMQDPPLSTYWFTIDLLLYSPTASFHTRDSGSLSFGFAWL